MDLHRAVITWYSILLKGQVPGLMSSRPQVFKQSKTMRNLLLVQSNPCCNRLLLPSPYSRKMLHQELTAFTALIPMILPKRTVLIGGLDFEEIWAPALWIHPILGWWSDPRESAVVLGSQRNVIPKVIPDWGRSKRRFKSLFLCKPWSQIAQSSSGMWKYLNCVPWKHSDLDSSSL